MKTTTLLKMPLALVAAAGLATGVVTMASAQTPPATYTARLAPVPLNGANGAGGTFTVVLNGNQAAITGQVSGLAATFMNAPYPHVQHIHGGAEGVCPVASADTNGDGVLNVAEGAPAYGGIVTTLSVSGDTTPAAGTNVQTAPSSSSFSYNRTITVDPATMNALTSGKAVIVVHGLDPAMAAPAAASSPSELVPSLPLAATSPALCGTLTASTMRPPSTGDGNLLSNSDSGTDWALPAAAVIGALGLAGAATFAMTRGRSK